MKKTVYTVFAFAAFAASALASPMTELDLKVPFAFKAGAYTLPAGAYTVTDAGAGFVLIRGEKSSAFVPKGVVLLDLTDSGKASFLFNRVGDKYILRAVRSEK
jgi:hypothetical protein